MDDAAEVGVARGMDDAVNAAETVLGGGNGLAHRIAVRDVGGEDEAFRAIALQRLDFADLRARCVVIIMRFQPQRPLITRRWCGAADEYKFRLHVGG